MTKTFDLILRGGTCVSHRGIAPADIGVRNGRIAEIGSLSTADADEVVDATGLRLNNLPATPDRVFAALEKRARAKAAAERQAAKGAA